MAEETPYQWVQRRKAEGASSDELAQQLAAQGLGAVEISRLLDRDVRARQESEPAPAVGVGMASPRLLLGALLALAGVVLSVSGWISMCSVAALVAGVVQTITAWGSTRLSVEKREQARLDLLDPDESRARCAVHPAHAAMGTCPRCGSFCCALCVPVRGLRAGSVCMACQALPEVQALRLLRASRGAAVTLLIAPATFVLAAAVQRVALPGAVDPLRVLFGLAVISTPWLGLAAVQANVRSSWPMALGLLIWLVTEVALAILGGRVAASMWLFPAVVAGWGWLSIHRARRGEPPYLDLNP